MLTFTNVGGGGGVIQSGCGRGRYKVPHVTSVSRLRSPSLQPGYFTESPILAPVEANLGIKYFNFPYTVEAIISSWNVTELSSSPFYQCKEDSSQILSCILVSKDDNHTKYFSILSLLVNCSIIMRQCTQFGTISVSKNGSVQESVLSE